MPTSNQGVSFVGVFTDLYRPKIDGVSIVVESYVKEILRKGVNFDLYAPQMPGHYLDDTNIYRFHSIPAYFDVETRIPVPFEPRYLKRAFTQPYRIIHSHTPGPIGMVAGQISKFRNIPHVHTFHGYLPDYAHYFFGDSGLSISIMNRFASWWANQVDYLIVPSRKVKNWLEQHGVEREIRVIPNGINLSMFAPIEKSAVGAKIKNTFLVNAGLVEADDFVLLYVGRIAKEKSVDLLIEYVAPLLEQFENCKLVLVGNGPDKQYLEDKVRGLTIKDQIVFTGYFPSSTLPHIYRSADIFTFLSTSETQGMVVLEAIASGLPVVVSNDAAFEQMVIDGRNGYYVNTERQFADAVRELYHHRSTRISFAQYGLEIAKFFDISLTTQHVLDYYDYIVADYKQRGMTSPKNMS
ncbi:MAG: glycosyltransferase [Caldilinea sp.]